MRQLLIIITSFMIASLSQAKVVGVASKVSLLQQLQISLGITIAQMELPPTTISKLPLTNELTEIKPSFFASWTQTTFLACKKAIQLGSFPVPKTEKERKEKIVEFATNSWGVEPSQKEVDMLYQAGFSQGSTESDIHKMSIVCSAVLSSPKVYVIAEEN